MTVKGVKQVKGNLIRAMQGDIPKRHANAVTEILRRVRAISDSQTPMDTSFLVNSGYAPIVYMKGNEVTGHTGYTASYAAYVHNMPGTLDGKPRPNGNGVYWGPDGTPKFLEKAGIEIQPEAMEIVKNAIR